MAMPNYAKPFDAVTNSVTAGGVVFFVFTVEETAALDKGAGGEIL